MHGSSTGAVYLTRWAVQELESSHAVASFSTVILDQRVRVARGSTCHTRQAGFGAIPAGQLALKKAIEPRWVSLPPIFQNGARMAIEPFPPTAFAARGVLIKDFRALRIIK